MDLDSRPKEIYQQAYQWGTWIANRTGKLAEDDVERLPSKKAARSRSFNGEVTFE